jgi:signal transduction histidine kinase
MLKRFVRLITTIFSEEQTMQIRRFPLAFLDTQIEQDFKEDYFIKSLSQIRHSLLLGMIALGAFGIVDIAFFNESTSFWLCFLRYVVGWAGFLVLLAFSFSKYARAYLQVGISIIAIWIGICILGMIYMGWPASFDYYVGLIMCFIFGYTFTRARFATASIAGCVLLVLYEVLVILVLDTPLAKLIISSLFMIVSNFTCMAICYSIELRTRREFFLRHSLQVRTQQLQDAQRELVEKERQAVLGELSSSMAHELRNPLGVISNAVEFLKIKYSDLDETFGEYLHIITSEVHNGTIIITSLLDFANIRQPNQQMVQVCTLVQRVLQDCPSPEQIGMDIDVKENLSMIYVDPDQVGQALVRLVENAYQSMSEGGTLTIKAVDLETTIAISISDTGCGFSQESMEMIFKPLYSTKARGIGLGLPIAKKFIEVNDGKITAESRVGKGSTFSVVLPKGTSLPNHFHQKA